MNETLFKWYIKLLIVGIIFTPIASVMCNYFDVASGVLVLGFGWGISVLGGINLVISLSDNKWKIK